MTIEQKLVAKVRELYRIVDELKQIISVASVDLVPTLKVKEIVKRYDLRMVVEAETIKIYTKVFIVTDEYANVAQLLENEGYQRVSMGKESHWRLGG